MIIKITKTMDIKNHLQRWLCPCFGVPGQLYYSRHAPAHMHPWPIVVKDANHINFHSMLEMIVKKYWFRTAFSLIITNTRPYWVDCPNMSHTVDKRLDLQTLYVLKIEEY